MNDARNGWRRRLVAPFRNGTTGRLRAPWRIALAVAVVLVLPGLVLGAVLGPLDPPLPVAGLAANATYALTAAGLLVVWARYVDRRPVAAYGFVGRGLGIAGLRIDRRWLAGAGLGLGIGVLVWAGALATDLAFGWARIDALLSPGTSGLPFAAAMGLFALQWLLVGFWEEAVFRGIVLRNAVEGCSLPGVSRRVAVAGGLLASALLFGGLHAGQAGSTAALGFWVLTGVVLGGAYLLTDSLALPVGLHAAFDLAVNNVLGLASVRAAGREVPTLVRPVFVGPDRFVEVAGLVNTAWVAVAGVAVLVVVRWRHGSLRVRLGVDAPPGDATKGAAARSSDAADTDPADTAGGR